VLKTKLSLEYILIYTVSCLVAVWRKRTNSWMCYSRLTTSLLLVSHANSAWPSFAGGRQEYWRRLWPQLWKKSGEMCVWQWTVAILTRLVIGVQH